MKVYIAGPFFNDAQLNLIKSIESILTDRGYAFYSPRIHSGSDAFTPEDRKDPAKWKSVFRSNTDAIDSCDFCIAVVNYLMPLGRRLCIINTHRAAGNIIVEDERTPFYTEAAFTEIEVADNGTCWEMGAFFMVNKPIIGFVHGSISKSMNLMLTHSVDGVVQGFSDLQDFLKVDQFFVPPNVARKCMKITPVYGPARYEDVVRSFNWQYADGFSGEII